MNTIYVFTAQVKMKMSLLTIRAMCVTSRAIVWMLCRIVFTEAGIVVSSVSKSVTTSDRETVGQVRYHWSPWFFFCRQSRYFFYKLFGIKGLYFNWYFTWDTGLWCQEFRGSWQDGLPVRFCVYSLLRKCWQSWWSFKFF